MTGTRIWLLRHAEPLEATSRCYGRSELEVPAHATEQAAAALAPRLPTGVPIVFSPRLRCAQLAQALRRRIPGAPPVADPRIAEMDFGDWEGQSWTAIGAPALAAWTADFADWRVGGGTGESVRDVMRRVAAARSDWAEASPGDVVWVSHAGVGRAMELLEAGRACPQAASEWPRDGIGFGAWRVFR